MIAAVDGLRGYCDRLGRVDENIVSAEYVAERCAIDVRRMADEIEREVAERYVELPVDADGVTVRVGDVLKHANHRKPFTVESMELFNTRMWTILDAADGAKVWAKDCRHAKPRTVEDVLEEFIAEYDEWDELASGTERMVKQREVFAKYADELRELMGVD